MKRLTPEDLINNDSFELLAEVEHKKVKDFVMEQVMNDKFLVRKYGFYQAAMIPIFLFLLVKASIAGFGGTYDALGALGLSILFSGTLLVIIHEFIHALAYWATGSRNLSAGAIWKKFIFYVAADRQVIGYPAFRFVALAPFVVIKVACIILTIVFWTTPMAYFFMSVMCIHSLFCGGDIAMLAFYHIHADKEIYNFDDLKSGRTFFYVKKQAEAEFE